MDSHNVARGRASAVAALQQVKAKTLAIGIKTDILFPVQEQKFIAEGIPGASLEIISSLFGHDGFLLEYEQIEKLINSFIKEGDLKKDADKNIMGQQPSLNKLKIIT